MRLCGCAHGVVTKTVHKTLPGSLFGLYKTGHCAVISSQISSKFTGKVVHNFCCMTPHVFLVSMFSIVQDLGQSEVSDNNDFYTI